MTGGPEEPRHPVRVVHQRTGLTPATLRAWERRYGVVRPGRTEGRQRLYSDEDVERLTLLRALTESGRPIRLVAGLPLHEARTLLEQDRRAEAPPAGASLGAAEGRVAEALAHARALDGDALHACLRQAAFTLGAPSFLDDMVAPFLTELGEQWARGEIGPGHEHLASAAVEAELAWLTDSAPAAVGNRTIVLVTLPGERHQLGARLAAAAATLEGWKVAYLGADLPPAEITRAARGVAATAVAVSAVLSPPPEGAAAQVGALRLALPAAIPLLVGGRGAAALLAQVGSLAGVQRVEGLAGLRAVLRARP